MRKQLTDARRLIVKVGSSLLTDNGKGLNVDAVRRLSSQVAAARKQGRECLMVSSGAVAAGVARLRWTARPQARVDIQVAAAVGQMCLIDAYEEAFSRHGLHAAQVLLTAEDMAHRTLYLNARNTLRRMLACNIVPVVNENDVIATDLVRFGDNDKMAAQIANLLEADVLLMLTDVAGLCRDKEFQLTVREAAAADDSLRRHLVAAAGDDGVGQGGMASKLAAAKIAARSGAHSLIADGRAKNCIVRALAGDEDFGTLLVADTPRLSARKRWLASGLNVCGTLTLDAGAVRAVVTDKRSLLPAGVSKVCGDFMRGDSVQLSDAQGATVGYALVNYNSQAAAKLCGVHSKQIAAVIGYVNEEEIAHRDNMTIL